MIRAAATLLLLSILCACDSTRTVDPIVVRRPAMISLRLNSAPTVSEDFVATATVVDSAGNPVPQVKVQWSAALLGRIASPGCVYSLQPPPGRISCLHLVATVDSVASRTDVRGEATTRVRPHAAGAYRLTAMIDSLIVVQSFDATMPAAADSALQWRSVRAMPFERKGAAAAVFGSRIYVVGGECTVAIGQLCDVGPPPRKSVQILDPASQVWSVGAAIPGLASGESPIGVAAGLSDGVHFILARRHLLYNPSTDSWSTRAAAPDSIVADPGRFTGGAVAEAVDDKLYVIKLGAAGRVLMYDPAVDRWTSYAARATPLFWAGSAVIDGMIYLALGVYPTSDDSVKNQAFARYDPRADRWTTLPPSPLKRPWMTGGAVGGRFCVFGGGFITINTADPLRETYCYNPATNRWSLAPSVPWSSRTFLMAAIEFGAELFTFGGGPELRTLGFPSESSEAARLSAR